VLSSSQELRAIVVSERAATGVTIDGQITLTLNPGDEVIVRKSPLTILLAASSGKGYFEILRAKLNWGRR
jgi:NAD+ kinase